MAALVDVHVGRALPPSFMPGITLLSLLYGLAGPAARAYCGVPMFGATPASEFAAAGMFIFNVMMFLGNFMFAATCAWHYRRLFCVMRALSRMARFPGEPLENFFPAQIGNRGGGVFQGGVKEVGVFVVSVVSRASEGGRGRHSRGDVSVRKTARRVDRREGPRELPRVVSGASRDAAGGILVGAADEPLLRHLPRLRVLLRGHAPRPVLRRGTLTHRLATAACFYFLAIVISALVSLTVFEAAAINEQVPETRSSAQARERGRRRAARLPHRGGKRRRGRGRKVASEARDRGASGRARADRDGGAVREARGGGERPRGGVLRREGDARGGDPRGVVAAVHAADRHAARVHHDGERGVGVRRGERRVRDGRGSG